MKIDVMQHNQLIPQQKSQSSAVGLRGAACQGGVGDVKQERQAYVI